MHGWSSCVCRDMKAENVLLGKDGAWKLCDFGSATTRHGRIERIEDMGVEEDVIRKTTTPAYRSPEVQSITCSPGQGCVFGVALVLSAMQVQECKGTS